ncbi:MAG: hypothetical protein A3B04_01405 [Candidatus Portnoybacteria bacterium RIFCSPLOWO2_02_FULL_39_11]|uniref:Uncharacterized protein n=1 Tax=Candidatus Portnoybacteria bacterium RIFCSPLOWO2_02_FULL_39_11 TaxID=1802001 RepID=A0A1G2FSS3_9BACT|nr:MAG: hypothetical protein A3B04_01405 [Candidatus Portnoybacteria bacterium RIFCSPLOWO2_02_FULL_39_11]
MTGKQHTLGHVLLTAILVFISLIAYQPMISRQNFISLSGIIFFGALLDIDHISFQQIADLLNRKKERLLLGAPVSGWRNWLHTWQAFIGIVCFSVLAWNLLPLLSFIFHIMFDGANKCNLVYRTSLLPTAIHPFYPEWLKYSFGPQDFKRFRNN